MKMTSPVSLPVAVLASAAMLITSCSKSVTNYREEAPASTEKTASAVTAESVSAQSSPAAVTGTYTVRGSRTQYRGQANEAGDNITVIYDYFGTRKVAVSIADKGYTCGYGSDAYVEKGWKYIIRINQKTQEVSLSVNKKMLSQIKPGSFEVLNAIYIPETQSFQFQTRYTAMDGNESEVIDLLDKQ